MLSKILILFSTVILNTLHFFIPPQVFNYQFDPLSGVLALGIFSVLLFFTSGIKKDYLFISVIVISFVTQLISYYQNGGVPDYINLYFFQSNIPDFFISITILTWWYLRVYKHPKINPATIKQDA